MSTSRDPAPQPPLVINKTRGTPARPWLHLLAGASGGIVTAIVTSPLDILRTRLQSDLYASSPPPAAVKNAARLWSPLGGGPLRHVYETFATIGTMRKTEGWRGLYRGLGPSLAGVVPTAGVKYYVYGNSKHLGAWYLGCTEDAPLVHAQAAVAAGVATATATNPIWLVKTRLQLDRANASSATTLRQYSGSLDCVRQVLRTEGVAGFYRGLSASYLGTAETVIHLVLYERLKVLFRKPRARPGVKTPGQDELASWASTSGAAGCAKAAAVLVTYPHEVVRTRLRQPPAESVGRGYTSLVQCFQSIWGRDGWRGFYGGLTPHLVRSIPAAVLTLGVYEFVLRVAGIHKGH